MRAIMADNDIQGHMNVLVLLLHGDEWRDIWFSLNLAVRTFADLYPQLAPGALIEGTDDPRFRAAWAASSPLSFQPSM